MIDMIILYNFEIINKYFALLVNESMNNDVRDENPLNVQINHLMIIIIAGSCSS